MNSRSAAYLDQQVPTLRNWLLLARLRYENGTSFIDVLDAERNLFNDEVALSQTVSNVYVWML
jgi:outer membrane protein TolC